jgi:hypothetical protein
VGGDDKFERSTPAVDRIIDPIVSSTIDAGKNMSASGSDVATQRASKALWAKVNATRESMLSSNVPPGSNFSTWWAELKSEMPPLVHQCTCRAFGRATAVMIVDKCLVITGDGHCVCK